MIQQATWPSECECCSKGLIVNAMIINGRGKYIFNSEKEEKKKRVKPEQSFLKDKSKVRGDFWHDFH